MSEKVIGKTTFSEQFKTLFFWPRVRRGLENSMRYKTLETTRNLGLVGSRSTGFLEIGPCLIDLQGAVASEPLRPQSNQYDEQCIPELCLTVPEFQNDNVLTSFMFLPHQ